MAIGRSFINMWISSTAFLYLVLNVKSETKLVCENNDLLVAEFINETLANYECKNFNETAPKLRKCCPLDHSFDLIKKACIFTGIDSFLNESSLVIGIATKHEAILKDYQFNPEKDKHVAVDGNYDLTISKELIPNENYCIDRNFGGKKYALRILYSDYEICKNGSIKCIRKCCPDGYCYHGKTYCTPCNAGLNVRNITRIKNNEDDFALIHGSKCKKYVGYENKYDFYLDEDGYFHIKLYRNPFYVSFAPDEEMYCLEHVEAKGLKGDYFFICFQANSTKFKFQVTRIGLILSCIFLLLTLFGYGFLPEMQNLFGKTLMCYCSALLLLFALLAHLQFNQNISNNRDICAAYGFLIMCSSLASFAWLNTMCFDIWWTFGAPKGSLSIQQRDRERKRFIWYNIYGWCVPILLTAITSALHYTKILPKSIHPEIGGSKCYFEKINNNYGYQIFFVLPITIIFVCNAILFIKTVVYCMKVKSEINKMNDTNAAKSAKKKGFIADKEKMMLLLKLFIVMGISWLFEAVSSMISFEDNTYLSIIEIVWDTINSLQGVFIFLIFICKRKILEAYKKKFGMKQRRQSITSGATHSTSLMSKQNSAKDTTKSI